MPISHSTAAYYRPIRANASIGIDIVLYFFIQMIVNAMAFYHLFNDSVAAARAFHVLRQYPQNITKHGIVAVWELVVCL